MAWETSGWQASSSSGAADSILVQESQRAFMSRVHGWMFIGLLVTGFTAALTFSNPEVFETVMQWRLGFVVAQLGAVFALSFLAPRLSGPVAAVLFLGYSALTGMTLSVLMAIYTMGSLAQAFFLTATVYGAMALYGTVTKKNLSAWGTFLFMGLVGVVLASVVNLFLRSDAMGFVVACASVVVFAGLTAYDTQKLRAMHTGAGYNSIAALSIVGALRLYLDFINLFIALLRLTGSRR
ncbi:Bax inhibitor-1/YccA family protein [Comamonas sp. JC664]|uniref:Bax inhibitor-1/YccA family protein n=1 Tax=Comamonas sp. JC664 TaxID=2801917 RepID=UPI00174AE33B|nr:Bax inhibitor-1/YccA family protein [Comamonas sp. JC664]MBL0693425.1 Bax inhibitor-1/YccA family protein [Comamonas sp. JC664]GHG72434.1 membrane protein [Comamonas sp. KCTC 72670]